MKSKANKVDVDVVDLGSASSLLTAKFIDGTVHQQVSVDGEGRQNFVDTEFTVHGVKKIRQSTRKLSVSDTKVRRYFLELENGRKITLRLFMRP